MDKYFEILEQIKKEQLDITKLYLLSCLDLSNKKLATMQMQYCYEVWLDIDTDIDLAKLADIVSMNWEKIQNDEMLEEEIIEECVVY